jgi:hypothetical protein
LQKIQTQGVHHITVVGADRAAIEALIKRSRESLSDGRDAKDPYQAGRSAWLQTS